MTVYLKAISKHLGILEYSSFETKNLFVGIKNSDIPTINCELKYLEIIGAKII